MNLDHLYFLVSEIPIHVFSQFFFLVFPPLESQQFLQGIVISSQLKLPKCPFPIACVLQSWPKVCGWWDAGGIHPPHFGIG